MFEFREYKVDVSKWFEQTRLQLLLYISTSKNRRKKADIWNCSTRHVKIQEFQREGRSKKKNFYWTISTSTWRLIIGLERIYSRTWVYCIYVSKSHTLTYENVQIYGVLFHPSPGSPSWNVKPKQMNRNSMWCFFTELLPAMTGFG